jgi:hypothetical protein
MASIDPREKFVGDEIQEHATDRAHDEQQADWIDKLLLAEQPHDIARQQLSE